jgi:macrodomain Ter protein organizer (MatP/YcbG family)
MKKAKQTKPAKPGRKPIPASERKQPRSIAIDTTDWAWLVDQAQSHGVTVSQFISSMVADKRGF